MKTSTSTINEFCVGYVKYQNIQGHLVTTSSLKDALLQKFNNEPWLFGVSTENDGIPKWESVSGTFRSHISAIVNKNRLLNSLMVKNLFIVKENGDKYVFDKNHNILRNLIGSRYGDIYDNTHNSKKPNPVDIHTFLQYKLVSIGVNAGLKVYVPPSDRNKKCEGDLTINKTFSENIVDNFDGYNDTTKEIDVIFIKDNKPFKAYEVENSTGVITGINRLSAISSYCDGRIVSTQSKYRKTFENCINQSLPHLKNKVGYLSGAEINRRSNDIDEYKNDQFDDNEIRNIILNKL